MKASYTARSVITVMILTLSSPVAALKEHYRGALEGMAVSASFDLLANSVTGVLAIGEAIYLLEARSVHDGYHGRLLNLDGGEGAALSIRERGERVELHIDEGNSTVPWIVLQPTLP